MTLTDQQLSNDQGGLGDWAYRFLGTWMRDHKNRTQIDDAKNHNDELKIAAAASKTAQENAIDADRVYQDIKREVDPKNHQRIPTIIGALLVAFFIALDAVPLYWAAESLNRSTLGTDIIFLLLYAGSIMLSVLLETNSHRRQLLYMILAGAALIIGISRFEYLASSPNSTVASALVASLILTGSSLGLILISATVLSRTRRPRVTKALRAANKARKEERKAKIEEEQRATVRDRSRAAVKNAISGHLMTRSEQECDYPIDQRLNSLMDAVDHYIDRDFTEDGTAN
ncbi:MAG: hypothetical protein ACYDHP_09645 [Ferrimicrobium sp.]